MGRGGHRKLQIDKPKTDAAEYDFFVLPNKMQVVIISDKDADKAAAAMDVRVGSMSDPKELPGLAHFLEHMLFYSNKKYPEEDAYMKFMAEHGGGTNAYTAAEDTNYHFVVNFDSLEPALDRFAQFFICPLISEDGVAREANAVDSEHSKNINSDGWRINQLWRLASDESHPFSYFHTGSLDTLITQPKKIGIDCHLALRELFQSRYSANLMRLAVYGKESLEDLRKLVEAKFEAVANRDLDAPQFSGDALEDEHKGILLKFVPQRENRLLIFQWAIPPQQHQSSSLPSHLLSHLLGYEGKGSCFSLLKNKGWVLSLSAGDAGGSFSSQGFFGINLTLTEQGQSHVAEIGEVLFYFIRLIQSSGVTQERFDEYQALQKLGFNHRDKPQPESYTSSLAQKMQEVQDVETLLLTLNHVPVSFDQEATQAILAEMTASKTRLMWASKDFQGSVDRIEPWYGTQYSLERLPEEWISAWNSAKDIEDLHLPEHNLFIPDNLELVQDSLTDTDASPHIVLETELIQFWHKTTTQFKAPKAVIYLAFHSPAAYSSPESATLCRIFAKLVNVELNEIGYDASLAGLDFSIRATTYGFLVTFAGYNDKMLELVKKVLSVVFSTQVEGEKFEVEREAVERECKNRRYEQPYQTAMNTSAIIHEVKRWHWEQYEEVVGDLTAADLKALIPLLWKRAWVKGFATGNWTAADSDSLGKHVDNVLKEQKVRPIFEAQREEPRVAELAQGCPALYSIPTPNPENENSSVFISYQLGEDNPEEYMKGQLWVKCMQQEAFHQLRTQQQLGYIVALSSWSNLTINSIAFIVQSSVYGAALLEERCEEFLLSARDKFLAMTDTDFARHVEELVKSKLEVNKRLKQQGAKEWREIDDGTLMFDRKLQDAAALKSLTQGSVAEYIQTKVMDRRQRRKLSIQVEGQRLSVDASNGPLDDGASEELPKAAEGENGSAESGSASSALQSSKHSETLNKAPPGTEADVSVEVIDDIFQYRRRQKLFPSAKK